ncbi:host attachment protein [Acidocella sp.]|uniref:baeRF12 domain-containing protein n=1 Tax=Acidocella sp. TaxID=50710 RepID=UPI0026168109|nr:host attachment protein [Acidocella sp.]
MAAQHLNLLIVIADAEHARFVRPAEEDNTLRSSSRVQPEEGHGGAENQAHNQHPEKFATWVAGQLNQHAASYDELVLVAPAHTLSLIGAHLDKPAQARLIGKLDKDLAKISDHDLWPHVKHWVRPVHRAKLL